MKKILFLLITLSCLAQGQDILDPWKNFALVQAKHGYDSDATTIVLVANDGAKLPQPSTDSSFYMVYWDWFAYRYWWKSDPYAEIVKVTARSGDTLTVTRAQLGTTARNHNTYGRTYKLALDFFTDFRDKLDSVLKLHRDSIRDVANYGATGVGDTTFKWSVSGSAQVTDSLRFVAGTGVSLSRTGNAVTITNTSADSAGESDTSRASYWATELRNTNLRRTTPAYTAETDKYLRADSTWVTPSGVGDMTAVNTNLPLSGGATSGAATLSVDTSNATYGLTNLRVNGLNQLDSDTNTVDATRYWVLNSAGVLTAITVGNGLTGGGSTGDVTVGVDSTVLATQYDLTTATTSDSSRAAYIADTAKNVDSAKYATQFDILNVRRTVPAYTSAGTTFLRDDSAWAAPTADSVRIADTARASYWATKIRADSVQKADTARASYWSTKLRPDSTQKSDTARASYWASNIRGNYIKPADTTTQRTYSNTLYAQDTLNLIAGEGLTGGGELSADRTFAIDTSSSRIATQYDISVLDSDNVSNYGLSIVDIDSAYTILTAGDSGFIAIWTEDDSLDASNMGYELLDTSNVFSYAPKGWAGNASNLVDGTLNSARLATSGVTAGSYTNSNITVDSYGRVTSASNGTAGSGGGGGGGFSNSFVESFTTTAARDTVSITGATSYDFYMAQPMLLAIADTFNANDNLRTFADSGRAITIRGAGGYSGLWYSLGRQQMDLAQPTSATATALSNDSIAVAWTDPVSSQDVNARTVDSIVVTWTTAAAADTYYTNTTNRRFVDMGVGKDTIPGLSATTLYQITLFSFTTRDETDTATCFASATTEEPGTPPAGTEPFKADSLGSGTLRLWIAGRFITGDSAVNGARLTNGYIRDSSGTVYGVTYSGGVSNRYCRYVDSMAVGDSGDMPGIRFHDYTLGDTMVAVCNDTVATYFSGAGDKPFTIVMVASIHDTSGTHGMATNSNQTFYSFADSAYTWNVTDNAYSGVYDDVAPIWMKSTRYDADANSATIGHSVASGNYYKRVHIYEYIYDGDSIHMYMDGDSVHSGLMNYDGLTFKTFSIGALRLTLTAEQNYTAMVLGEFCIWSSELSQSDRAYYRAKLKSLYGTP